MFFIESIITWKLKFYAYGIIHRYVSQTRRLRKNSTFLSLVISLDKQLNHRKFLVFDLMKLIWRIWVNHLCMYVYVDIFFNLIILKLFCFLPKNLLIIYLCIPKLGWVLWSVGIVHTWYKEEKAKIKELSNWWQLILLSYYLKMWACKIP